MSVSTLLNAKLPDATNSSRPTSTRPAPPTCAQRLSSPAGLTEKPSPSEPVTVAEGKEEPETYHIVGYAEADPKMGRISNRSPLGQALLGHRVGDEVIVNAPDGILRFRIMAIQ